MKRTFLLVYGVLVVIAIIAAVSCSDGAQRATRTALLTSKSWSFSKIEIQRETGRVDVSALYLMNCEKSNVITFAEDGGYSQKSNAVACNPGEKAINGTWSLKEGETILEKVAGTNLEEDVIVDITSDSFTLNVGSIPYDENQDGINETDVALIYTYLSR